MKPIILFVTTMFLIPVYCAKMEIPVWVFATPGYAYNTQYDNNTQYEHIKVLHIKTYKQSMIVEFDCRANTSKYGTDYAHTPITSDYDIELRNIACKEWDIENP